MTRTPSEAFAALEGAMARVIALETQITDDCEIEVLDRVVEQLDYQIDIAIGAWADLVVADVISDFAAHVASSGARRPG
jgi:hypothetical protein